MSEKDNYAESAPFLSRWSQRKQAAREKEEADPPVPQMAAASNAPPAELPPVEQLTLDSDFSGFLHPKVDPQLRQAALRKLFSDPHFNVMDGLDTYVDDYSKPDPLPPGMLAGLRQAQNILAWAKETKEETAARFAPPVPTLIEDAGEPARIEAPNGDVADTASHHAPDREPDSMRVIAVPDDANRNL